MGIFAIIVYTLCYAIIICLYALITLLACVCLLVALLFIRCYPEITVLLVSSDAGSLFYMIIY